MREVNGKRGEKWLIMKIPEIPLSPVRGDMLIARYDNAGQCHKIPGFGAIF